jgi:chemotaxis protein MotB
MAGKGGGAWKVAYADFVTAMMAFFLVMWIVAQNKDAKEAVSAYFRDPFGDASRPSGTGHLEGSELKLKPPPETKLKGGAKVPILKMIHDREGTPVGSFVQFKSDSSDLDAAAKYRLDDLAPLLLGKQNKIEIRGHTARRSPAHDAKGHDPWRLSYDRCLATMKYLTERGIDAERIRLSQAGPHEPTAGAESASWQLRNSRVEIIMLNEYIDDFTVTRRKSTADEKSAGAAAEHATPAHEEAEGKADVAPSHKAADAAH